MNRIKAPGKVLVTWWHWILALIAVISFVTPLHTPATEEDPTGSAGLYAPLIALCTAAVLLTQAMKDGGLKLTKIQGIFIGLGSMASAYFWMAAEYRVHPTDLTLPIELSLLLLVAAVVTIVIPFIVPWGKSPSDDRASSGEDNE